MSNLKRQQTIFQATDSTQANERSTFRAGAFSGRLLFGAVVFTTLIFTDRALAQDALQVAQRGGTPISGVPKPGETKPSVTDGISVEKLRQLDFQSQRLRGRLRGDTEKEFFNSIDVDFAGRYLLVDVTVCKISGCAEGLSDAFLGLSENGKTITAFDLTPLKNAYEQQNPGKKLNYMRLILEQGQNSFTIHIAAVDYETQPISSNMQVVSAYCDGYHFNPIEMHTLAAMQ